MPGTKIVLLALTLVFLPFSVRASQPRWSHLHIDSATLTTGSGAPLRLTNADIELPPKELKNIRATVIQKGVAFITSDALTVLLTDKISNKSFDKLRIQTEDGQRAKISGSMKKAGMPIPVTIEGPVTLTPAGMLRLQIKSEKALGVPMTALADAFGISPEKSVKSKQAGAVHLEKDAVLIDPSALLGTAEGRVVEAKTSRRGLTLRFGSPDKRTR